MSDDPLFGLIAAGPVSPALFRMEGLNTHLGPVCSASLRVASRLVNRMKGGRATRVNELNTVPLVLLTGPESAFAESLALACDPSINWKGRIILLLDSRRDARDLAALEARGASTGTLDAIDAFTDLRLVADVDEQTRRPVLKLAKATRAGVFFLDKGQKQVFQAGTAFTGSLLTPLVAAAVDCLKKSGLSPADSVLIAERMVQQTIRAWLKAGRKGWSGAISEGDMHAVRRQLNALGEETGVLRQYFAETAHLALLLFGEDPAWLHELHDDAADS